MAVRRVIEHQNSRFVANVAGALLEAARAGFGIALLPTMLVAQHVQAGHLGRVLPQLHRAGGGLHLVLSSSRQVPAVVAAFATFATDRLRVEALTGW